MKKSFKFLAMALCLVLVMSVCVAMFAAKTETSAADYKDGEWVTVGTTFKFDGKDYTVQKDTNFSGEYITVGDMVYYLISDADDVKTIAYAFGTASFIIANDIELGAWTEKIGAQVIVLEGCGHTLTFGEGSTVGLFDGFAGTANNLVLDGTINADQTQLGGFTRAMMDGVLDGITNNADIVNATKNGDSKTAGIAAYADISLGNFVITNCVNNGDITGEHRIAGIVGNLQTNPWNDTSATGRFTLRDCVNNGTITSNSWGPGGIMSIVEFYGSGEVNVINCVNNGNVNGPQFAGGIVGTWISSGMIEACVNTGDISSVSQRAGGILGRVACGDNATVAISNCANMGDISSQTNDVAGIAGLVRANNISFAQCFSVGELTAGVVTNQDQTTTNKTAYGILNREKADISTFAEKCFYMNAEKGMNQFDQESDIGELITADQLANGYIATQFNAANEAAGNDIRWTQVVGTDPVPVLDQTTLVETTTVATTKATTKATTTAATTEKPVATTKAPINAQTTAADDAEEEGGCGSSLAVASIALLTTAVAGTAIVTSRKRK